MTKLSPHATSSPILESNQDLEIQDLCISENEKVNKPQPQPPQSSKPPSNRNYHPVRPSTAKEKSKDVFIPGNMEWNCQYRFKKVEEKNDKHLSQKEQKQNIMDNIIADSYETSKDDFSKRCFNEYIPDTVIPNNQRVIIRSPCVPIDLNNTKNYLCLYDEKEHLWETIV